MHTHLQAWQAQWWAQTDPVAYHSLVCCSELRGVRRRAAVATQQVRWQPHRLPALWQHTLLLANLHAIGNSFRAR